MAATLFVFAGAIFLAMAVMMFVVDEPVIASTNLIAAFCDFLAAWSLR